MIISGLVKPQLPDSFEEKTFEKLENAIKQVLEDRAVQCSQEELYRVIRALKYGRDAYFG